MNKEAGTQWLFSPENPVGARLLNSSADVTLIAYWRALNNRAFLGERQIFIELAPRLIGTHGTQELARRRAFLLVDRHIRSAMPALLRSLPDPLFDPHPPSYQNFANALENLPPIVDSESAESIRKFARGSLRFTPYVPIMPPIASLAKERCISVCANAVEIGYATYPAVRAILGQDAHCVAHITHSVTCAAHHASGDIFWPCLEQIRPQMIEMAVTALIEAIELK